MSAPGGAVHDLSTTSSSGAGRAVYECTVCGRHMMSKRGFQYHMDQHRGIYPYYCPYCNKGMAGTSNLKSHLVEHAGRPGYACIHCHDATDFQDVRLLREHLVAEHGYDLEKGGKCKS